MTAEPLRIEKSSVPGTVRGCFAWRDACILSHNCVFSIFQQSAKLRKLPPFLTVSLLRFSFDFVKCERYKETSCCTFPLRIDLKPFCEQVRTSHFGMLTRLAAGWLLGLRPQRCSWLTQATAASRPSSLVATPRNVSRACRRSPCPGDSRG